MTDRDRVHVIAAAKLIGEERCRHEGFMERALRQARRNPDRPFGAVIVERATGELLAEAVNAVHEGPILHGETAATDACARSHPGVCWPELTLHYRGAVPDVRRRHRLDRDRRSGHRHRYQDNQQP